VNELARSRVLLLRYWRVSSARALSIGADGQNYWPRVHSWDRCLTLSARTVFGSCPGTSERMSTPLVANPLQSLQFTVPSEFLISAFRLLNLRSRLVRIHAFHVARVHRCNNVVVGLSGCDRRVRIVHHCDERGIQLRRVRPARCCSAVDVVSAYGRRAGSPCKRNGRGSRGHARARKRDRRWRARGVARDADTSAYRPRSRWSKLTGHRHRLIRRQGFAGCQATRTETCSRRSHT